jgi:hypothetical protein
MSEVFNEKDELNWHCSLSDMGFAFETAILTSRSTITFDAM